MKKIVLFVLMGCLLACSPQRRIARIAERYNLYQTDTLVYKDTLYIPAKSINAFAAIDTSGNFFISGPDLTVKGKITNDTVYLEVETKPDTIYINKSIPYQKIQLKDNSKTKIGAGILIGLCIGLLLFVALVIWLLIKRSRQ